MIPKYLRLLSCAVLCLGIASVLFFSYKASAGQHVFNGIIAWALVPYFVAFIPALLPQGRLGAVGVLLGCLLLVGASAWAYYDAFFVHTDAQNGLVFVFFPPWQLAFCVVLLVCAGIASVVSARSNKVRAA